MTSPATTSAPTAGDDAGSRRTVNRVIVALLGLAVLVAALTFWFWRSTRPLHPALEGVELVGSRAFRRASPERRTALLAKIHQDRGVMDERQLEDDPRVDPSPVDSPVVATG